MCSSIERDPRSFHISVPKPFQLSKRGGECKLASCFCFLLLVGSASSKKQTSEGEGEKGKGARHKKHACEIKANISNKPQRNIRLLESTRRGKGNMQSDSAGLFPLLLSLTRCFTDGRSASSRPLPGALALCFLRPKSTDPMSPHTERVQHPQRAFRQSPCRLLCLFARIRKACLGRLSPLQLPLIFPPSRRSCSVKAAEREPRFWPQS